MRGRFDRVRRRVRSRLNQRAHRKAAAHPRTLLAAAGWTPGRRVSIQADISALRAEGYATWPELSHFLELYSGVSIVVPRDGHEVISFDGAQAAAAADREWVAECAGHVGAELVPIGRANNHHAIVLLARDGRLFATFPTYFWSLGDTVVEAIER
jgi:SUKH-3 immunity protein